MNNIYEEENTFSFGNTDEKTLGYSGISGLGESDYENEDLFNEEVSSSNFDNRINKDYMGEPFISTFEMVENESSETMEPSVSLEQPQTETSNFSEESEKSMEESEEDLVPESLEYSNVSEDSEEKIMDDTNESMVVAEEEINSEAKTAEKISFEGSALDLQKVNEYTEEKINSTDIKSLFDRVGVNVKEASDIFKKNTEMKEKLDTRFEELKKLKSEIEKTKKDQYEEINSYKEEVLTKLTEKKEEIEKRLNKLKEFQANLEKEKAEFEEYRKNEKEEIDRVQKEIQDAYDSRRDELTHIEDALRKQKDSLDEERSQLSLDMIQYEADKNELANNLLKFNEIVASFTNGMEKIEKE